MASSASCEAPPYRLHEACARPLRFGMIRAFSRCVRGPDRGTTLAHPTVMTRWLRHLSIAGLVSLSALAAGTVAAIASLFQLGRAIEGLGVAAAERKPSRVADQVPHPSIDVAHVAAAPTLAATGVGGRPRAEAAPDSVPSPHDEGAIARCAEPLRLIGSVVDARDPTRSMAAIRMNGGTRLAPLNATVGSLRLAAIHPSHAYFRRRDGALCQLPVFLPRSERTAAPQPPPAAPAAGPVKFAAAEMAELSAGIRQIGPDRFAVTRETLSKALGSPTALRRSGRFRVKQENGRTMGMQLVHMRSGSPLGRLGLKQGDVVRKVNGLDLSSPDGALQAVQVVKTQQHLTVAVLRDGAPHQLEYDVQ